MNHHLFNNHWRHSASSSFSWCAHCRNLTSAWIGLQATIRQVKGVMGIAGRWRALFAGVPYKREFIWASAKLPGSNRYYSRSPYWDHAYRTSKWGCVLNKYYHNCREGTVSRLTSWNGFYRTIRSSHIGPIREECVDDWSRASIGGGTFS